MSLETIADELMRPKTAPTLPKLPAEVVSLLELGCQLSYRVRMSPMEPHIQLMAAQFINRANKVAGNV